MKNCATPFLTVPPQLAAAIAETCAVRDAVSYLEELVVLDRIEMLPLFLSEKWRHFRTEVCQLFKEERACHPPGGSRSTGPEQHCS